MWEPMEVQRVEAEKEVFCSDGGPLGLMGEGTSDNDAGVLPS